MPILNGKEVGPIGYGLMGLTTNDLPDEQTFAAMRAAVANNCTAWNGGEFYGPPERNSLTLLNKYFAAYPDDAAKVSLNIKGCVLPGLKVDGSRAQVARSVDGCLAMLPPDRKKIDVFEPARRDPNVPLEETLGAFQEYVRAGKIGGVAISEVNAKSIREAAKISKIESVEIELSLWATDPLENGIVEACGELGIPILAYRPIGNGMLAGKFKKYEDLPENYTKHLPRFQAGNFEKNMELVDTLHKFAKAKGCTPAQLAINWLLALSKRPGMPVIIPIPGASTAERVEENSRLIEISEDEMQQIDKILGSFNVVGTRYPEEYMHMTNT